MNEFQPPHRHPHQLAGQHLQLLAPSALGGSTSVGSQLPGRLEPPRLAGDTNITVPGFLMTHRAARSTWCPTTRPSCSSCRRRAAASGTNTPSALRPPEGERMAQAAAVDAFGKVVRRRGGPQSRTAKEALPNQTPLRPVMQQAAIAMDRINSSSAPLFQLQVKNTRPTSHKHVTSPTKPARPKKHGDPRSTSHGTSPPNMLGPLPQHGRGRPSQPISPLPHMSPPAGFSPTPCLYSRKPQRHHSRLPNQAHLCP